MRHSNPPNDHELETIANRIVELGLETPAVLFLESQKPLATIFFTTTLALEPIGSVLFSRRPFEMLRAVFSDREACETLIQKIEKLGEQRRARAGAA